MATYLDLMAFAKGNEEANQQNWRDVLTTIARQQQQQNLMQQQAEFGLTMPVAEQTQRLRLDQLGDQGDLAEANRAVAQWEGEVLSRAAQVPAAQRAQFIANEAKQRMSLAAQSPSGAAEVRLLNTWVNQLGAQALQQGDRAAARAYFGASAFGATPSGAKEPAGRLFPGDRATLEQREAERVALEAAMRDPTVTSRVNTITGKVENVSKLRPEFGFNADGTIRDPNRITRDILSPEDQALSQQELDDYVELIKQDKAPAAITISSGKVLNTSEFKAQHNIKTYAEEAAELQAQQDQLNATNATNATNAANAAAAARALTEQWDAYESYAAMSQSEQAAVRRQTGRIPTMPTQPRPVPGPTGSLVGGEMDTLASLGQGFGFTPNAGFDPSFAQAMASFNPNPGFNPNGMPNLGSLNQNPGSNPNAMPNMASLNQNPGVNPNAMPNMNFNAGSQLPEYGRTFAQAMAALYPNGGMNGQIG